MSLGNVGGRNPRFHFYAVRGELETDAERRALLRGDPQEQYPSFPTVATRIEGVLPGLKPIAESLIARYRRQL